MTTPAAPDSLPLQGRRAVVTGGASGLGLCIARQLSAAGAALTVVDLESALDTFDAPGSWQLAAIDLGAQDSLDAQRRLAREHGSVDIVIANAGIVPPWRRFMELDAAQWQQVMAVNAWGVAATIGGFAQVLAASSHAAIVVMASINAYRAHPQQALYTASKHAALGIMRAAALDLGRDGIRVNALAPGPVATEALVERIERRHASGGPSSREAFAALDGQTALGAIVSAEQVARAALWLASDDSAGVTGTVLPIEAGLG